MILVDPDLDPDPDAQSQASTSKRVSSIASTQIDRRDRLPSSRTLVRFLREAQAMVRLPGQVSVMLTTDANIRRLNRQFRKKDKPTDVLSFPAPQSVSREVAGDLAISVPTARRQARDQGHSLAVEIKVLLLHGLLHLAGYDHERDNGQMARREHQLRARLNLPSGLIERTTEKPHAPSSGSPRTGPRSWGESSRRAFVAKVGTPRSRPASNRTRPAAAKRSPRA